MSIVGPFGGAVFFALVFITGGRACATVKDDLEHGDVLNTGRLYGKVESWNVCPISLSQ